MVMFGTAVYLDRVTNSWDIFGISAAVALVTQATGCGFVTNFSHFSDLRLQFVSLARSRVVGYMAHGHVESRHLECSSTS